MPRDAQSMNTALIQMLLQQKMQERAEARRHEMAMQQSVIEAEFNQRNEIAKEKRKLARDVYMERYKAQLANADAGKQIDTSGFDPSEQEVLLSTMSGARTEQALQGLVDAQRSGDVGPRMTALHGFQAASGITPESPKWYDTNREVVRRLGGWERPRCMTERYERKRYLAPALGLGPGVRNARLRARRKARGLCVDCNKPAVEGQTRCQYHRDMQKAYRRHNAIKRAPWYRAIHGATVVALALALARCGDDGRALMRMQEVFADSGGVIVSRPLGTFNGVLFCMRYVKIDTTRTPDTCGDHAPRKEGDRDD